MAAPEIAAAREHALAVTRNYISQPRLSEWEWEGRASVRAGGGTAHVVVIQLMHELI